MNVKELRNKTGLSQAEFCKIFPTEIPKRTLENWETDKRKPPDWVIALIKYFLDNRPE